MGFLWEPTFPSFLGGINPYIGGSIQNLHFSMDFCGPRVVLWNYVSNFQ